VTLLAYLRLSETRVLFFSDTAELHNVPAQNDALITTSVAKFQTAKFGNLNVFWGWSGADDRARRFESRMVGFKGRSWDELLQASQEEVKRANESASPGPNDTLASLKVILAQSNEDRVRVVAIDSVGGTVSEVEGFAVLTPVFDKLLRAQWLSLSKVESTRTPLNLRIAIEGVISLCYILVGPTMSWMMDSKGVTSSDWSNSTMSEPTNSKKTGADK
jgi:hypothetical protein